MRYEMTDENKKEVLEQIERETSGMKEIAKSFGYELIYPFFIDYEKEIIFQGSFKPINDYLPKIRLNENNKVEIDTVSYGSLDIDEYEKYQEAVQMARNFAREIKDWFDVGKFPLVY